MTEVIPGDLVGTEQDDGTCEDCGMVLCVCEDEVLTSEPF